MINFYNTPEKQQKLMKAVYKAALKHFSQPDIFSVEIEIVSADKIREVNKNERGVDKVTDVLSFPTLVIKSLPVTKKQFPTDIDYESGKLMLGDIIICYEKVKEQAAEYGHSEEREAAYLTLHGILHLLGFDHIEDADRVVMRKHEEEILNSLGITRD